jgi:hypothetical protein
LAEHIPRRQVRRDGGGRHAVLSRGRAGRGALAASQLPTASVTHFLVKLVFAAPASFFSAACLSQPAAASVLAFLHEAGLRGARELLLGRLHVCSSSARNCRLLRRERQRDCKW